MPKNMASDNWAYQFVKDQFKSQGSSISNDQLTKLIEMFEDEIKSQRRVSIIRNIDDLLEALEQRDIVNEIKTEPLDEKINQVVNENDDKMRQKISHCCKKSKTLTSTPTEYFINEYALERQREEIEEESRRQSRLTNETSRSNGLDEMESSTARIPKRNDNNNPFDTTQFTGTKKKAIYNLIVTEIGRKWRDFGRGLDMREGEMDSLEREYPRDFKTQIFKMLEMFEEFGREDPRKHLIIICESLEACRRKDLSRKVMNIMTL